MRALIPATPSDEPNRTWFSSASQATDQSLDRQIERIAGA
jgi:hypothetical protein